jgi:hypothetical protein
MVEHSNILRSLECFYWSFNVKSSKEWLDLYSPMELFEEMKSKGRKLDHITFIGILSECSQESLVNKGRE